MTLKVVGGLEIGKHDQRAVNFIKDKNQSYWCLLIMFVYLLFIPCFREAISTLHSVNKLNHYN